MPSISPNMSCKSLPVRGAWIEIKANTSEFSSSKESLPVRGAWIEMAAYDKLGVKVTKSLPVRGAWIEIEMLSRSTP